LGPGLLLAIGLAGMAPKNAFAQAGSAPARQSIEDYYADPTKQQPPSPALWVIRDQAGVGDTFTQLQIPTILAILKYELATSTWSGLSSGFKLPGMSPFHGPGQIFIPTDANIQRAIQEILNDPALKLLYTDDQSLLIHSSGAQTLTPDLFLINRGGFYSGQGLGPLPPEQLGKHLIHELGHVFQQRNWNALNPEQLPLIGDKEKLPTQLEAGLPLGNLSKDRVDALTQLLRNKAKETVTQWDWSGQWSTSDKQLGTMTFTKISESEARAALGGNDFGSYKVTCPPLGSDTEFYRGDYTACGGTGKIIACANPTAAILDGRSLFMATDGTRTTGFFRAVANLKTNKPNQTFTAEYAADKEFVAAADSPSRDKKSLGRSLQFSSLSGKEEGPAKTQATSSVPAAGCGPELPQWKLVSVTAKTPVNPDAVSSFSFPPDDYNGLPGLKGELVMNVPAMMVAGFPAPVSASFTGSLTWNKGGSTTNELAVVSLSTRSTYDGSFDPSACVNSQDLGVVKAGSTAAANVTVSCQWTVTDFGSGQDTIQLDASAIFSDYTYAVANLSAVYQLVPAGSTPGPATTLDLTPETTPDTPPGTTPGTTPPSTTGKINLTVTLSANQVKGGTAVTGTVYLSQPAPAGGLELTFDTDAPDAVAVPGVLAIPAGATSSPFPVITFPVTKATDADIFVDFVDPNSPFAGDTDVITLTVTP
jgi:hypothetical protein